jgi:hypothetical protein
MPIDPRVERADTVAVFVHGVGAHDARKMTASAERGFWDADDSRAPDARTCDLRIELGCGVPGPKDEPNAFAIRAGGETHVVVPVVWCNFRSRIVADEVSDGLLRALTDSPAGPLIGFTRAVPRLLDVCSDALECANVAATSFQRLLLRVAVAVIVAAAGVACLFVLFAVVAPLLLGLGIIGTFASDLFSDGRVLAAAMLATVVLAAWSKLVLSPYDYIGDVASYVASDSFREAAARQFASVLRHVAEQAPNARIVVVGHSLGSVLVSHALLNAQLKDGRKPVLVTLGSPLARMSRWFPHLRAPQQLLLAYRDRNLVEKWYHFWREGDYIGGALMPNRSDELYAEKPLGPGGHADYWGDERLWRELVIALRDRAAVRRDVA